MLIVLISLENFIRKDLVLGCFRHHSDHSIHFSQENQQKLNTLQTHIPKPKGCIQPVQTASTSNFCDVQQKLKLKMSLKLPHFMSTLLPLLFLGCWIWSKRPVPPKISAQSLNDSMVRCASLSKFEILPHSPTKSTPPWKPTCQWTNCHA